MSKDTVSALDGIKEVLKQTQAELPAVDSDDNGKVLTVKSGKWDKDNLPKELPAVTAEDEGNVLMVDAEGEWDKGTIAKLPAVTPEDVGKVLTVNADGEWVAVLPE